MLRTRFCLVWGEVYAPGSVDPDRFETVGVVEMVVRVGMMTLKIGSL